MVLMSARRRPIDGCQRSTRPSPLARCPTRGLRGLDRRTPRTATACRGREPQALSPSTHVITAHFDPWGDYADSTSDLLAVRVVPPPPAVVQASGRVALGVAIPASIFPPGASAASTHVYPRAGQSRNHHAVAGHHANGVGFYGSPAPDGSSVHLIGLRPRGARLRTNQGNGSVVTVTASVTASASSWIRPGSAAAQATTPTVGHPNAPARRGPGHR